MVKTMAHLTAEQCSTKHDKHVSELVSFKTNDQQVSDATAVIPLLLHKTQCIFISSAFGLGNLTDSGHCM